MTTPRSNQGFPRSSMFKGLRGSITMVVLFAGLLLALVSAVLIETVVRDVLDESVESVGVTITRGFAATAVDAVLLDSQMELHELMDGVMRTEPDVVYILVIGSDGEVVGSTFDGGVPADLLTVNVPAVGTDHSVRQLRTEAGLVLDVAVPMLGSDAGVAHVGVSAARAQRALAETRITLLVVAAAMAFIGILVSFHSGRIIARPLGTLAAAAADVQAGDLSVRADVSGIEEVRFVADAFNDMLDTLQDDIRRRRAAEADLQRSRDELEVRVHDRTEELADANEELEATNEELAAMNEELAAANQDLEAANRALEEATRAKSQFLASMSHELRTPLNSVIGFSDIMLQGLAGPLTDEQRRQLDMVRSSGTYLLGLINDVLDLARVERGQLDLAERNVDVREVAEHAFAAFRPLGEHKELHMEYNADGQSCVARTDPMRLEQILVNLLGNAVKFTESGRIEMSVTCDGHHAEFRVTDTGPGIPEEAVGRIFEEFYQVPHAHNGVVAGTGLGLAISRRIADALGGTLRAESTVGEGSTFILILPV